jgi:hypothetical protein
MSLYDATDISLTIEEEKMTAAGTLWEQEIEMLTEQSTLAYGLMEHYNIWVGSKEQADNPWGDNNLEFLDMETVFNVPILTEGGRPSSRVWLGGRFDGIVRRRDDGSLWLFESKTSRSILELQKTLAFDEQAGGYIYAAQLLLGEQIYGVVYNIMRKKVPTRPRVLNTGELSKNKNIDSTFAYYWSCIEDQHPDLPKEAKVESYRDILEHLNNKGNTFFSRTVIRRTEAEIEELARNLRVTALEMVRPSTVLYPAPGWTNCTFCRFTAPCLAMNSGHDYEMILDHEYRKRTDREFRPYLLYGFHFVPIANNSVSVWYYGERIVIDAPNMVQALAGSVMWIVDQERSDNGYVGPSGTDLSRGAKELGLWQAE